MARFEPRTLIRRYTSARVIATAIRLALLVDRCASVEATLWTALSCVLGCLRNTVCVAYVLRVIEAAGGRATGSGQSGMVFSGAFGLGLLSAGGGGAP